MVKKEFKLDYIEVGRLSSNEMNEFYGGEVWCHTYTACVRKKGSCSVYFCCDDPSDPIAPRNYCGKYTWVPGDFELEALETSSD